jgi:hypothetical protein
MARTKRDSGDSINFKAYDRAKQASGTPRSTEARADALSSALREGRRAAKSQNELGISEKSLGQTMAKRERSARQTDAMNYAKGGSVTRGDGICTKGHTKGRMI